MCFGLDLFKTFYILHQKCLIGLGTLVDKTMFKAICNCVTRWVPFDVKICNFEKWIM